MKSSGFGFAGCRVKVGIYRVKRLRGHSLGAM